MQELLQAGRGAGLPKINLSTGVCLCLGALPWTETQPLNLCEALAPGAAALERGLQVRGGHSGGAQSGAGVLTRRHTERCPHSHRGKARGGQREGAAHEPRARPPLSPQRQLGFRLQNWA